MNETTALSTANAMIDRAAQRGDAAIQAGADLAHQAVGGLSQSAQQLQADAQRLRQRGLDTLRDGRQQLRDSVQRMGERTTGYIQNEPVKSVVLAAVTGAALMALFGLMGRSTR